MNFILNDFPKPVINSASGAYVFGDKKYIDTCLGNGTHILGHHSIEVENCLYGAKNNLLDEWEILVKDFLPFFDKFVLCNTGSEATMRAVRIARAYTGKETIAIFEGGHHGSADWSLTCEGVPKQNILILPYNDERAFDIIHKYRKKLAMVFIEPVQGSNPRNMNRYLHTLKGICKKDDVLLGFDEVITGFRLARGGAAEYFQLYPDICTYGKVLGGGLPIGMIAGKADIMNVIQKKDIVMGGTFSGNPATIQSSINILKKLNSNVYFNLNEKGRVLRENVKNMIGCGSMNRKIFTDREISNRKERDLFEDSSKRKKFYDVALENGVYVGKNGIQFLSTAHSEEDIEKLIEVFNCV